MKTNKQIVQIVEDKDGHFTVECDVPLIPTEVLEQTINQVVDRVQERKEHQDELMQHMKELADDTLPKAMSVITTLRIKNAILWVAVIALLLMLIFIK